MTNTDLAPSTAGAGQRRRDVVDGLTAEIHGAVQVEQQRVVGLSQRGHRSPACGSSENSNRRHVVAHAIVDGPLGNGTVEVGTLGNRILGTGILGAACSSANGTVRNGTCPERHRPARRFRESALPGSALSGTAPSGIARRTPGSDVNGIRNASRDPVASRDRHCPELHCRTGAVRNSHCRDRRCRDRRCRRVLRRSARPARGSRRAGSCVDSTADPTDAASASTRSRASVSSSASALAARMNQVSASASRPARSSRSA